MKFKRICVVVLDSVGIGEAPDAHLFGDEGSNTLGHIAESVPAIQIPNLQRLGLGNIAKIDPVHAVDKPEAFYGKMQEISAGKDTMTGHWELMGLQTKIPFQTYPDGFPNDLIQQIEQKTGRTVVGNKVASGTAIIDELGPEQLRSGSWIIYTSADSVLQIAAHEEVIPLEELYEGCRIARRLTMGEPYPVGRVIARPYIGEIGQFVRTANRHDYAVKPPKETVLNQLKNAGYSIISIGKINDIFSGEGITQSHSTKSNDEGMQETINKMKTTFEGVVFTNLVDFDSMYGHRRDPEGYARALEQFDQQLPELMAALREDDLLIITADHGNDPTFKGTDHTREYVPLLVWGPSLSAPTSLNVRQTFADVAATIAENYELFGTGIGTSFLHELN